MEFLLIGGHAAGIHGEPRFTRDIDLLIRPTPDNARRLWADLTEFGAPLSSCTPEDFTAPSRVVQFGVEPSRFDFTMSIQGVSFEDAWRERVQVGYAGLSVPVIGRRHLILNKQATGREKDLRDVRALLASGLPPRSRRAGRRRPRRRKKSR